MAKSFLFHLLAPYILHLGLVYLLFTQLSLLVLGSAMFHVGALVLLLSILFGVYHVYQTICVAPGWRGARRQFLAGLMNPSLAILTIAVVFFFEPDIHPEMHKISAAPERHDAIKRLHHFCRVSVYSAHSVVLILHPLLHHPSNDEDLV